MKYNNNSHNDNSYNNDIYNDNVELNINFYVHKEDDPIPLNSLMEINPEKPLVRYLTSGTIYDLRINILFSLPWNNHTLILANLILEYTDNETLDALTWVMDDEIRKYNEYILGNGMWDDNNVEINFAGTKDISSIIPDKCFMHDFEGKLVIY